MYAKSVTVALLTTTGDQNITFTPNSGDPDWIPKVAIFQWSRGNPSTNAFADCLSRGYGFTDGTTSRTMAFVSEDAVATVDSGGVQYTGPPLGNLWVMLAQNPTGTIPTTSHAARFNQWLTNGVRLTYTSASGSGQLNVLFLGGDDITNTAIGTLQSTTGASCSITGLSFQPDFAMFMSTMQVGVDNSHNSATFSIGCAKSSSAQWSQSCYSLDGSGNSAFRHYYSHGKVVLAHTTSLTGYSVFSTFNSDGLTLNNTDAHPVDTPIYYLCMKGGTYAVGNATEPAGTGNQTITTNLDTKAVMIFGVDSGTADTVNAGMTWTSGFGDNGLNQTLITSDEIAASDPTANASRVDTDQIYQNITANATSASSVLDDEASLNAVSSTGFTLNWSNIGQARPFRYVAFGGKNAVTKTISETSVSVSESLDVKKITFFSKVVTYTANTATGDQTLAGAGFTPKAAIVFHQSVNNTQDTATDHASFGIGWTDGTDTRSATTFSIDNSATSSTGSYYSDSYLIPAYNATRTIDGLATFSSFNSDGMVINWSDAPTAAFKFHVLYLGGPDLTGVKVGTFTPANHLNNVTVTGIGFTPDLVMTMGTRKFQSSIDTAMNDAGISLGAATSSTSRWSTGYVQNDGELTMDTWQHFNTNEFITCLAPDSATIFGTADFVSMDYDSFTIDMTEATGFSTDPAIYFYLALRGGQYSVGNATEPASTGDQTITTNTDVKGLMVFGVDTSTGGDPAQTGCVFSAGAGTSNSNMVCTVFEDTDNVVTSISAMKYETDSIYLNITSNATAASTVIDDEATLSSLSSTGFVLNWSNVGQTRPFFYVTFGNRIPKTYQVSINETAVSVPDYVAGLVETTTLVKTQVVRFRKDNSGTPDVTQEIGLSFTPKAIMITSEGNTLEDTTSAHFQHIEGFSDGTNQACTAWCSIDNLDTSSTASCHRNDSVFVRLNTTTPTTIDSRSTVSFGTNKVTFTWVVNDTADTLITLWAIGGQAITNAKVNTVQVGSTGTGVKNYTGLGWNPAGLGKSVLFTLGTGSTTMPAVNNGASFCKGWGLRSLDNSAEMAALSLFLQNGVATSNTGRRCDSGYSYTVISSTTGAASTNAGFSNWITDGFSLNFASNGNSGYYFSYLVIEGGTWNYGVEAAPASTGAAAFDVDFGGGVGGRPIRGFHTMSQHATTTSLVTHASISTAFHDGVISSNVASYDEDAQTGVSDSYRINRSNGSVWTGFSGTGTLTADARFVSFGTDLVNLDYQVTSSGAYIFGIVVADAAEEGELFPISISESAVSLSDSNVRILASIRALAESTISTSEQLARLQTITKAITDTPSISTSAQLVSRGLYTRAITVATETPLNVNESLAKLIRVIKTISETSITVPLETITRLQYLIKTISETPIDVSELLTIPSTGLYIRPVTETLISVDEALNRLRTAPRPLSQTVVIPLETIARIQYLRKGVPEPTVSSSANIVRLTKRVKTISETPVTVPTETISRIQYLIKSLSENVTIPLETIQRIQYLLKTISESNNISAIIQANLLLEGLIIEPRIKWYYSTLVRKIPMGEA